MIYFLLTIIIFFVLLIDKKGEELKSILSFIQSIIITGMILCSIIYLTKFSHETQSFERMISDLNTSLIKEIKSLKCKQKGKVSNQENNISKSLEDIKKLLNKNKQNIINIKNTEYRIKKSIQSINQQMQNTNIMINSIKVE